jgi:hypothetical protein
MLSCGEATESLYGIVPKLSWHIPRALCINTLFKKVAERLHSDQKKFIVSKAASAAFGFFLS